MSFVLIQKTTFYGGYYEKKFVSTLLIISILSTGLLSGCGKSSSSESVDLTSVSLDTIKEKAKEEGTISSVGMPDDWANWKGSWENITSTYGLEHDDTDMTSSEELSIFESEKDSPTKDIGDVGQAFGPTAVDMDVVQPYKASTWDSIPDWAKDPDGKWTISYLGTMSALVNTNNVSDPITSWEDLKNSDAKVTLGDVLRGASSQMAVYPVLMPWVVMQRILILLLTTSKNWQVKDVLMLLTAV